MRKVNMRGRVVCRQGKLLLSKISVKATGLNRFHKRQARRLALHLQLKVGAILALTRGFADGSYVTYYAEVVEISNSGRPEIEILKEPHRGHPMNATFPIPGYQDWFLISAHPVLLAPHARIRGTTGLVMTLGMRPTN